MTAGLPHYCVVGGGLSGLATAYFLSLAKAAGTYRLTLLEGSSRFGGWIRSVHNPITGAVYDLGPHSARVTAPVSNVIFRMALGLNLQNSFLWMCRNQDVGRSYIYVNGKLTPVSPLALRTVEPFTRSSFGLIMRRLLSRPPSSLKTDISADQFFRTRFDDEFADYYGSAMLRGIFAGDSRNLSAKACLPLMVKAEETGPNMFIGLLRNAVRSPQDFRMPEVLDKKLPAVGKLMPSRTFAWSLLGGMQTLTNALVDHLHRSSSLMSLNTNAPVRKIDFSDDHYRVLWGLTDHELKTDDYDAIFLCCPSYQTVDILKDALEPKMLARLTKNSLPWNSVVTVAIEVDKSALPPFRGFGHLVPRTEDPHVLGIIYDSIGLPQLDGSRRTLRYTVLMLPHDEWFKMSESKRDAEIGDLAAKVLKKHLKLTNLRIVNRRVDFLHDCIPQYPPGHLDNICSLRSEIQASLKKHHSSGGLHLVGFSYDGVGLGDVVRSSLKAVATELNLKV
ncbi:unnamed protein product [Calicophoron daubneyi]|uniref:Protoporphyrinogen oxidase n=1 Tax=Calicophoron daubneyi TaxID=300641 RepID=A0AAV2THC0_CALDB